MVGLTDAGSYGAIWLLLAVGVAVAMRRPWVVALVASAVVAANLTATGLKAAVGRERPEHSLDGIDVLTPTPHDASFPSGHAATSFAAALVLTVAVPRLATVFFGLAAAIAYSRLYVGVHYPLDVLGGAVLGALVATALLLLVGIPRRARRRRKQAPPTGPLHDCSSRRAHQESR